MKNLDIKKFYVWPIAMRALIIGLVCLVVFYLGYSWDIVDLNTQLSNNQQQENDLKQQLQLLSTKQISSKNDLLQLPKLREVLGQWEKKFISHDSMYQLLNEILKIGSNNHLQFSTFVPGKDEEQNFYIKTPIKVVAVGTYHQIAEFISQVANLPQIVSIDDFIISSDNKSDLLGKQLAEQAIAGNLLTVELTLEVYHFA